MTLWTADEAAPVVGEPCALLHPPTPFGEVAGGYAGAAVGHLCRHCIERLRWALNQYPDLIAAARAARNPARVQQERVSGTKDLQLPFNADAVEAADELWATLSAWATNIAEHIGSRVPAVLEQQARADVGDRVQLSASVSSATAHWGAQQITRWMESYLDDIAALDFIPDLHHDLVTIVKQNMRYLPRDQPPPRQPRTCPACGHRTVHARLVDDQIEVTCATCGHRLPIYERRPT